MFSIFIAKVAQFYMKIYLLLATAVFCTACQSSTKKRTYTQLLTATEARQAVVRDTMEDFFDKIVPLEMAIQMQKPLDSLPRAAALHQYQQFIQADVADFSESEAKLANEQMQKALNLCYKINPNLPLPDTIRLIKTRGDYYGSTVYYTRENCIVIPAPQLVASHAEQLMGVLIHEIFHIYSRYNPQKRNELYKLIGFAPIDTLALGEFLQKRVFYNPDGVDMRYSITLRDSTGRTMQAIPVIYSRFATVQPAELNLQFFDYLTFQLFEIQKRDSVWAVVNPDVGYSVNEVSGFWEQIGRNTNYTIHPEEVIADNFKLLAWRHYDANMSQMGIDSAGQELLRRIEAVLQSPN